MRRFAGDDGGYSIIEILVALGVFSLVSAGFLSVMLSVGRSSDTTRDSVRISEEARLGLSRIVRDTREAGWIELPGTDPGAVYNSFTVKIDYNGDGSYANPTGPTGSAEGHYEVLTYAYNASTGSITVTAAGFPTETLVKGVDAIPGKNVFSFTSNRLEYDWGNGSGGPPDGVTTLAEINQAACAPNNITTMDSCNSALVDAELATLTSVNIALRVTSGGRSTDYYAEAQLRNRR